MRLTTFFTSALIVITWMATSFAASSQSVPEQIDRPNVILIFADDQGYADIGCYGAQGFATPHLDRLAWEGCRFTSFYVSASVCSASRAALLTGCYHLRVGVKGVFFPTRADAEKGIQAGPGRKGLHPDEVTIAELLKQRGYATACFGKWHLGDAKPFLPTRQGFDEYFGIPYSNDMGWWEGKPEGFKSNFPPIPLLENESVIETQPNQRYLTKRYTERAVDFIKGHRDKPFFLYLPHTMPHIPLFASEAFKGRTPLGLYGDVIEEIDWSVGQIVAALRDMGLTKRTLVIFTSDNGPWLSVGKDGGCAKPLRDGKFTQYEGGHRMPCIMSWPGQIPTGAIKDGIVASIDLYPTIAGLAGLEPPADRRIDGVNLWPYISDRADKSPRDHFFYVTKAVRKGPWKLFLPGKCREIQPKGPGSYDHPRLYHLSRDIGETNDLHTQHPAIVTELTQFLEVHQEDLNTNARPAGDMGKL